MLAHWQLVKPQIGGRGGERRPWKDSSWRSEGVLLIDHVARAGWTVWDWGDTAKNGSLEEAGYLVWAIRIE